MTGKIKSNCRIAEKKEEENVRRMFVRYRRNDANLILKFCKYR